MELYALSHTVVAALIGLMVGSALVGRTPWALPPCLRWMGIVNWVLFNVFEFARKSYDPGGEPTVETYSKRLGPSGAAALSLSQFIIAGAAVMASSNGQTGAWSAAGLCAATLVIPVLVTLPYVLHPARGSARLFRNGMLALALVTYMLLPYQGICP